MGLSADCAGSAAEARQFLEKERYSLCLTDASRTAKGWTAVRLIGSRHGETPAAVITAFGSADNAVAALKAGAFDYSAKPVALDQLRDADQIGNQSNSPPALRSARTARELPVLDN